MANGNQLPSGFILDKLSPNLPAGFVLDEPETDLGGGIEPVATLVTGAIAEPIAGLAGLSTLAFDDVGQAVENIEVVREALTYIPRTQEGMSTLKKIGEFLTPVAEAIETVEKGAGDIAYEATDSPLAGALGTATPTAIISAIGLAPIRAALKTGITKSAAAKKLIKKAAPAEKTLRAESRKVFKEIEDAGVVVDSTKTDNLVNSINAEMRAEGFHAKLHPKVSTTLDEWNLTKGIDQPVTELNTLRKFAETAAASIDRPEKRLGAIMLNRIDDFMDSLGVNDFKSGDVSIGGKYQDARSLWARASKSKLLKEAIGKAQDQASGVENGLRIQFRQILNSKSKSRYFTDAEKADMKRVVQGTNIGNFAKLIGKFGFDFSHASNMLGGSIGTGIGYSAGGVTGAVVVPAIGSVSKILARKLTSGNAEFADAVVRAGKDGRKLADEYIKHVPAQERSARELSELLLRPNMSLKSLKEKVPPYRGKVKSKENSAIIRDALLYAELMSQLRSEPNPDQISNSISSDIEVSR